MLGPLLALRGQGHHPSHEPVVGQQQLQDPWCGRNHAHHPTSLLMLSPTPLFADQREKERDQRLQEARSQSVAGRAGHATETTSRQSTQSADGSACSTITKTERLVQSSMG